VILQFLAYDRSSNISSKLLELETSNLVGCFVFGMRRRRANNFPERGRGLVHVIPTIFGSTVGYPSDSLAFCSPGEDTLRNAIMLSSRPIMLSHNVGLSSVGTTGIIYL